MKGINRHRSRIAKEERNFTNAAILETALCRYLTLGEGAKEHLLNEMPDMEMTALHAKVRQDWSGLAALNDETIDLENADFWPRVDAAMEKVDGTKIKSCTNYE